MSSQSLEQRFVSYSSYNKPVSDTAMPVDEAEAWLDLFPNKRSENRPNGGIIRATESVIFTDMEKGKLSAKDIAAIKAQAQRDYKKALKNLHKQDTIDAKAIKKQQAIWKAEAAKEARRVSHDKRNAKKREERAAAKALPKKSTHGAAKKRLEAIISVLKSGGRVALISRDLKLEYDQQFYDMQQVFKLNLNVVLIRKVDTGQAYYIIDNFERYQTKEKLKTDMRRPENKAAMLRVLCSGQLLLLDGVDGQIRRVSDAVRNLANSHNLSIYTVLSKKKTVGWIFLD